MVQYENLSKSYEPVFKQDLVDTGEITKQMPVGFVNAKVAVYDFQNFDKTISKKENCLPYALTCRIHEIGE